MAQLNVYVPDDIEQIIRQKAKKLKKSISRLIADVFAKPENNEKWNKDFFSKVVGHWQGDFPAVIRDKPEARDSL